MSENEKRPGLWYPSADLYREEAEAWYRAPYGNSTDPEETDREESEKRKRRLKRTKVTALILSALVVTASVASVISSAVSLKRREAERSAAAASPRAETPNDRGGSYRDYFEEYYTSSNRIDIPVVQAEKGVSLTLSSHAGLPELSLQEVYQMVNPAVVGISTFRGGTEYSWGTGVIFREDGYIITNTHILQGADSAEISLENGDLMTAVLIGEDEESDIAVLKIEAEDLPYAVFGDSDEVLVGDEVAAIGNPLGELYAGTMTNGIVSSIDRNVTNQGHRMTLLQTNAALNEGNSGGPLVNMYGQVIGITNMKIMSVYYSSVEGIGFAVPSSVVKQVADELLATGMVTGEPTIGIIAGAVNDEAIVLYGIPAGVYVTEVQEGSDALAQGLQAGDIILKVDGISVASVADVNEIKGDREVGDVLTLTIYREGETFDISVRLVDKTEIAR